ncbi:hypothetical protein ALI22I_17910 [Saccharothrix sp. ALI-22-I]|uniref:hypothetical protein n=1 Tax=Saccharothrix sp. ALI-22-I TaxID=1933778 RepID=UPI00097C596A|nr:hypothetical protein [Saccharothrix sp. ALI-22-I]ONI88924.1 hypothetical protein ALI22I_17910 [Saccharothrix sp. ALI-22-I]
MSGGYDVDVEQLRTHTGNIDGIRARFESVKAASAHIAQDDEAYGLLCGWMSGILEGRHTKQDELLAYVEENLNLVVQSLVSTVEHYEAVEDGNTSLIRSAGEGLR